MQYIAVYAVMPSSSSAQFSSSVSSVQLSSVHTVLHDCTYCIVPAHRRRHAGWELHTTACYWVLYYWIHWTWCMLFLHNMLA